MKLYPLLLTASIGLLAACSKSTQSSSAKNEAAAPPAEPRRNAAESLGFASESSEGYFQNPPPAAAPKAPAAPAPSANSKTAQAAIPRTLTSKDGRSVEAVLLSRTDDAVNIRRKTDAAEFTIPLENLSDADRKFIQQSALPLIASVR